VADTLISLAELNNLGLLKFTDALLPLYGNAGWVPPLAFAQRPFLNLDHLHRALADIVVSADAATKEQMIHAQPDSLSGAGTTRVFTDEERNRLRKLQADYLAKFGFPLVISAAGETPEALLDGVTARLANSREQEVTNSLDEAAKIARFHLRGLVQE